MAYENKARYPGYKTRYPATFINDLRENGTKEDVVDCMQRIWDELIRLRRELKNLSSREKD